MKKRAGLIEARESSGMYQKDIAEMLGISPSFYSAIERGERSPTLKLARDISDLFGESIEKLFLLNQDTKRVIKKIKKPVERRANDERITSKAARKIGSS
ncbi:helix-turn-helix transcriptional regulator [Natroniella acetigena]|uniref:helix-turn-helix transcriptional regulator n=1 Tax=Natroniella acetigena TaxID=52004 RepID=UPI00200A3662|nr:helix-turn-helix transcriptional regulator [Natroniella acetigena]MCK8827704.1 helix-turn-helix transcriptional regulator [Natroniella acetigena]